jgi:hypothetical protein
MKTTLVLPDAVADRLRSEAERSGKSMSSVVVDALHMFLAQKKVAKPPLKLPSFRMGNPFVDVNNRNALYDAMEDE